MRVWTCQRKQQQYGDAILPIDIITTPDNTLIFVPISSPDDEGRAAFIVSACNAAERENSEREADFHVPVSFIEGASHVDKIDDNPYHRS